MMYNSKIAKEKYVSFVKLFNEIISSTVVWENDMPMFVLFAGAGCSASSEVALGGRMVQIIQKYSFFRQFPPQAAIRTAASVLPSNAAAAGGIFRKSLKNINAKTEPGTFF